MRQRRDVKQLCEKAADACRRVRHIFIERLKPQAEIDERAIEEGNARLDGLRHRIAILLMVPPSRHTGPSLISRPCSSVQTLLQKRWISSRECEAKTKTLDFSMKSFMRLRALD